MSRQPSTGDGELRIAVTMNGGVSLAIWMGGLASELLQLVRSTPTLSRPTATDGRYDGLLGLIAKQARIDVISGASAGGVNGSALALALARDVPSIDSLRDLWVGKGDIGKLLRPATAKDAPSLLSGEYFLSALGGGFAAVARNARRPATKSNPPTTVRTEPDFMATIERCRQGVPQPSELDLTLLVTGSALSGVTDSFPDDIGHEVIDTDHRAVFRFLRRDLEREGAADLLAQVSRASASFPGAFEPTWIALDDKSSGPNLKSYLVHFEGQSGSGLWMVDGGTLVNKPVGLALDAVFDQSASAPVHRMLAYVVPDPGTVDLRHARSAAGADQAGQPRPGVITDQEGDRVSVMSVISKALVGMPRNESIAAELKELRDHNAEVLRLVSLREYAAGVLGKDLVAVARRFEEAHRRDRARESVAGTMARLTNELAREGHLEARRNDLPELRAYLMEERTKHVPQPFLPDCPVSTYGEGPEGNTYWGYGRRTTKRIAATITDFIQTVLSALPTMAFDSESRIVDHIDKLRDAQLRVHCLADVVESAGSGTAEEYHEHTKKLFDPDCDLKKWAAEYYDNWSGNPDSKHERFNAMGTAALRCAEELLSIIEPIKGIGEWAEGDGKDYLPPDSAETLERAIAAIRGLAPEPSATDDQTGEDLAEAEWTLRQLLAVDLLYSMAGGHRRTPQQVELAQMSAFASDHVSSSPREIPAAKLTGVSLHHFGAFYKRSWRANDWMWGRLDGISRLVDMTIRPDLLRTRWFNNPAGLKAMAEQVATQSTKPQLTETLQAEWETKRHDLDAEIEAVCGGVRGSGPAKEDTLPHMRRAIARRLQLEVLYEELPVIAFAEAADRSEGDVPTAAANHFLLQVANAFGYRFDPSDRMPTQVPDGTKEPSVDEVVRCLDSCRFAEDQFDREAVDDRSTALAGQATAVATTAMRTAASRDSLRKPLTAVRGVGVFLYFLTSLVTSKLAESRVAQLGYLAAFAAGGAILSLVFLSDRGVGLLGSAIGLALVAVPVLVAMGRRGGLPVGLTVLFALLLALTAWNLEAVLDRLDWATPEAVLTAGTGSEEPATLPARGGVWGFLIDRKELLAISVLVGMFLVLGLLSSGRPARDAPGTAPTRPEWTLDRLAGRWAAALVLLLVAALVHEWAVDLTNGPVGLELAGSVEDADEYFVDACRTQLQELNLDASTGCGPDGRFIDASQARERDEFGQHLWIDTAIFIPAYVLAGSLAALRLRREYRANSRSWAFGTFLAGLVLLTGLLDVVENAALWGYLNDWLDWRGWPSTAASAAYPKWVGAFVFLIGLALYALGAWSRRRAPGAVCRPEC